jgi:hypothetical protein
MAEIIEAEVKSNIGEVTKDVEKLDKATDKASGGFKGVGNAIKGIGTAIKAAGIGLLVGLFAKLMDVFRQNQTVVDTFNSSMEFLSIAFNDFFRFISDNVGVVTGFFKDIFENPAEKVKELGNAIKQGFIDRFNQALEVMGLVAKSFGQLIKGEFSAAFDTIKEAGKETVDVFTGVDDSYEKVAETVKNATSAIVDYTKKTYEQASAVVALRNESELAAVKVQGLIEEYDRQAEKLRQVRDDETKTFEERIAANEELGRVLKEQEEEMLKLVDIQIQSAQADVNKNNNLENQIKLQEALNEKKAVEAQITGFQSEQLINQVSLQREQAATNEEAAKLAVENANAQLEAYAGLAGALSALAGDNKALAVAQATIDTYTGANKAYAQGGPLGFISAGAVIAAGFANIRKILQTDIPGGNGDGGGSVPAETQPPAPQMMSGAFELGGGIAPEPVKAYVVTDEMTNSQDQLANIRRRATI